MASSWKKFIAVTAGRPAVPIVLRAIKLVRKSSGRALDLGAGAGSDAVALAKAGFRVEAVDIASESLKRLKKLSRKFEIKAFKKDIYKFEIVPKSYDIIVAWNSLPFLPRRKAKEVLERIQRGLRPSGIAVISIFGPKDSWSGNRRMSFFTLQELRKTWLDMTFIKMIEEKKFGVTAVGEKKFWHVIRCIARRKP